MKTSQITIVTSSRQYQAQRRDVTELMASQSRVAFGIIELQA